jgi:hypothetical protein
MSDNKIQKMKSILRNNNVNNNVQNNKSKEKVKVKQDSSDISSYNSDDDNMTNEDIQKKARETYIKTELFERITKYVKIDNTIKEKQQELREFTKTLKKQKEDMEKYILEYLTDVQEEYVKIEGDGKLTKSISVRKGAIKPETIKKSVLLGLRKENINLDENRINDIIESILTIVDDNRPTTKKTYIKRTYERKKKDKKEVDKKEVDKESKKESKKDTKKEKKKENKKHNKIEDESDEELPKYR